MTSQEHTERLMRELWGDGWRLADQSVRLVPMIAAAIDAAVAEEREAAVKVAESVPDYDVDGSSLKYTDSGSGWIANAIRARRTT